MYTFTIGPEFEYGFSINEGQVLLLIPDRCEKLTDREYESTCRALSSRGFEFMYLPKLMPGISAEILDYFIPEQAGRTLVSYYVVQNRILGELELILSSPMAVINVGGDLIGLQSEEGDEDTGEFLRMLLEHLDEGVIKEHCVSVPCHPYTCSPCEVLNEDYTVDALIDELKELREAELRKLGLSESALRFILGRVIPKVSSLRISHHSEIVLDDYAGREIKLDDKTKALYFLYLRHPEGISIKDLNNHYNELLDLYQSISGRDNPEAMMQTITNLVDPYQNNVNISLSRIKKAFCDAFTPNLACKYYVDGRRGEIRSIALDRKLVIWETIISP